MPAPQPPELPPRDRTAPGGICAPSPGWAPAATDREAVGPAHAYVGNGRLGARIPPRGTGYAESRTTTGWPLYTPRYDGAFVSGLYAVDATSPRQTGRQAIAALPTWTGLDLTVGGETYTGRSKVSHYRQTLFLRCGFVRTSLTWTASDGRRTDLTYDVLVDRNEARTGAVRLKMTPHWDGTATVTDRIDGRGARRMRQQDGGPVGHGTGTMAVTFRTDGTNTEGAVASTLRAPGRLKEAAPARELSSAQAAAFPVRKGRSYEAVKYVGVDTALSARAPRASAVAVSRQGAARGWPALFAAHATAWRNLWSAGVETPGREDLQLWLRSAQYGLYAALRRGGEHSVSPVGLSSDGYAGLVFWDAETWIFPSLLATRPELAKAVLDYRLRTRAGARENARELGFKGLFYPWTSGAKGRVWPECHSWRPPHCVTQIHLQGDIALAVRQYWQATGDRTWLRERGWPLLKGIAEFWADRAVHNTKDGHGRIRDGSYSLNEVAGPDEYSNGVNDSAYTNAVAATALRSAERAARELGLAADPKWREVADGLRIRYDARRKIFLQYDGFERLDRPSIKQADTVLLTYPLEWPMPPGAAAATLDHYAAITDPDGPAMTDSVHAVAAATAGEPGCAAYTYLQRAVRPFVRGPFALFSEARGDKAGAHDPLSGAPAQDFVTGKGGFLQVFTHGLTGLRMREDRVLLDPVLPPQLRGGVKLPGLRWQGRTYDVTIGARSTTVRLRSGAPFTVEVRGKRHQVGSAPLTLPTRRPALTDAAQCRPVRATSEEPGLYAEAAVDSSTATSWTPATAGASLTVDLGRAKTVSDVRVAGARSYRVLVSPDGKRWTAYDPGVPGMHGRYVRITQTGEQPEAVRELRVRTAT
ncbi:glycosyl hydrolase family 65 protein [Streptomyces monticola]|uniref:Glycosyl hydrolase family 65 protein n=1 Tax=Streptomyces monticola TaxID=2666263 RepID=A0ABW2JI04_9ACTN